MIYLKFLSGDLILVDVNGIEASRLYDHLPRLPVRTDHNFYLYCPKSQPIATLFLEDRVLEMDEVVADESVVFVLMRSVFLVWYGSLNSVWPGDGVQCMNVYGELVEWDPKSVGSDDVLMVDYFSFGYIPPYTQADTMDLHSILKIKRVPSDFSLEVFKVSKEVLCS